MDDLLAARWRRVGQQLVRLDAAVQALEAQVERLTARRPPRRHLSLVPDDPAALTHQ